MAGCQIRTLFLFCPRSGYSIALHKKTGCKEHAAGNLNLR